MEIKKILVAVAVLVSLAAVTEVTFADQRPSLWKQEELNEQFMRSLSKRECMGKTVASLKAGCSSESCLKTLGGITGDCVTWATGDVTAFCGAYDHDYVARYCATNELDARRCLFLHVGKSTLCEHETKP